MSDKKGEEKGQTIEDFEKDTKHLMENQIKEINLQMDEIVSRINASLEKLRLGVLQKTINKLVENAFGEYLPKISDGLRTGFTLELRKVILEKFITSELSNLKERIASIVRDKDFNTADTLWVKVKEILSQTNNSQLKMQWQVFENEYNHQKKMFQDEQHKIGEKLGEIRRKIQEDVQKHDYASAESKWVEAKQFLQLSYDQRLKADWANFEKTFQYDKANYAIFVKEVNEGNNALKDATEMNTKYSFSESIALLTLTINHLKGKGHDELLKQLQAKLNETIALQSEYEKDRRTLAEYEKKFQENYSKDYLVAALDFSEKILEIAEKITDLEQIEKYANIKDQIEKRIEYQKVMMEKESQDLLAKAKEIEGLMEREDDVLPLVKDFAVNKLFANLSADQNEALTQISGILPDQRVDIKKELANSTVLKSETGEVFEEKVKKEIQKVETESKEKVLYNVKSGLQNPFENSIEEGFLKDLIPYNFEIMKIQVNGRAVEEQPEHVLTKDGLELNWKFGNIPSKEKVEISYDLRRRVSRTVIFYLKEELRIIKTHSKLNLTDIDGIYETSLPFTNNYNEALKGVIVEDIVPMNYVHFIKAPMNQRPELTQSKAGEIIKWDVGSMDVGTREFTYKLMEVYRYEELKIQMNNISNNLNKALNEAHVNEAVLKSKDIDSLLSTITK